MDQYEYIRTAHRVYGKSIRQIQKETGHSRVTIRKVLQGEFPEYRRRSAQPHPVLEKHRDTIEHWLKEDRENPKKQRHTARRIYTRLVEEEGYAGSEVTVRRYVRQVKAKEGMELPGVFLVLEAECGQEAEADWGRAIAIMHGARIPFHFFCMRSKFSAKPFIRAYPCEKQQAFFDTHVHAFNFFGGVFPTIVYDNLTSAVQKVLKGRARIEQEGFRKLKAYYNFEARFCNPAAAYEKGGTEGMIGYVRRNYLVPIPVVESFEELNEKLLNACLRHGSHRTEGRTGNIDNLFEREKEHLISLPAVPMSNVYISETKVNKYSTVMVDKNHYSVPVSHVRLKVRIEFTIDRVDIFYDGRKIAGHARLFGNNKWQLDPQHYLELIRRKPGAFDSALVIRRWRKEWPACLEKLLLRFKEKQGETSGIKDFISVLMLYRDYPPEDIEAVVELALENSISTSDGIKHMLVYSGPEENFAPLAGWPATLVPDVADYAQLGVIR
jgi:transposase